MATTINSKQWRTATIYARQGHPLQWCARAAGIPAATLQAALLAAEHKPNKKVTGFWKACAAARSEMLERARKEGTPKTELDYLRTFLREEDGWNLTSTGDEMITRWSAYEDAQEILAHETPTQRETRRLLEEAMNEFETETGGTAADGDGSGSGS